MHPFLVQNVARCPLCRSEIKTNELVEFPQEEMEEEKSTNSEKWRTSSKVHRTYRGCRANWGIKIVKTPSRPPKKNAQPYFFKP